MLVGMLEEQLQLAQTTRELLGRVCDQSTVRRLMATPDGRDDVSWGQLRELGLLGITVPEHLAGSGGSLVDQGVVLEEMGRVLYGGPYLSSAVLAVQTLLAIGDTGTGSELLGAVAGGTVVTVALTEGSGRWDEAGVAASAEHAVDGWRVSGEKTYVPDGLRAEILLVVARTSHGLSAFAIRAEEDGLTRQALPTLDATRKQASLQLRGARGALVGEEGQAWEPVQRALQAAAMALAAEQVGGAQYVLEQVVDYVRTRQQFGRPIGTFQAVQHKCATMLLEVEAAKSTAYYALRAAHLLSPEAPVLASAAKSMCSEAYRTATGEAIQLFGGIGLTWEHFIHLYFKRACSSAQLFGSPAYHRQLIARSLGLGRP